MTQKQKEYQESKLKTITEGILSLFEDVTFEDYREWVTIPMLYPENMATRARYKATNLIYLSAVMRRKNYKKPFFGTARQINQLGGSVLKGEKGYAGVNTVNSKLRWL